MADPFKVRISAEDGATRTIKKINTSLAGFTKPATKSVKSLRQLGQVGQRSLKTLSRSLREVSNAGGKTAKVLEWLTVPAAVTGVAALANQFGNFAFSLTVSSRLLDMNAQDLTKWHFAAKMAGVSADAFDQAMSGSQDAIRSASFGGDAYGLTLLAKTGVEIQKNTDGSIDYYKTQMLILDAAKKIGSVEGQREYLGHFGLSALIPMVQQNSFGLDREMAGRKGIVQSDAELKKGLLFWRNVEGMKASLEGLGLTIGSRLIPVIEPLVNAFSNWLDEHRVAIADELARVVGEIADWIRGIDWQKFKTDVMAAWTAIGGLKSVVVGLLGLAFAGPIANVLALGASLAKLGAFFVLNPIGLVIAAIGTLAAVTYELYTHWDEVKAWWKNFWDEMSGDTKRSVGEINDSTKSIIDPRHSLDPDNRSFLDHITDYMSLQVDKMSGGNASASGRTPHVVQYLMDQGLTRSAAIGEAANFWTESRYDPDATGDNGKAYGAGQWHKDRQDLFKKLMGHDIHGTSLEEQLRFKALELKQGDSQTKFAGRAMALTDDPAAAAMIASQYDFRPGAVNAEKVKRAEQAALINRSLGPNFGETPATAGAVPAAPPTGGAEPVNDGRDARISALQQAVPQFNVVVNNAQPGTRVEATSSNGQPVPTRISYSMGVSMGATP